jgi:hypothetical protein
MSKSLTNAEPEKRLSLPLSLAFPPKQSTKHPEAFMRPILEFSKPFRPGGVQPGVKLAEALARVHFLPRSGRLRIQLFHWFRHHWLRIPLYRACNRSRSEGCLFTLHQIIVMLLRGRSPYQL